MDFKTHFIFNTNISVDYVTMSKIQTLLVNITSPQDKNSIVFYII